MGAATRMGSAEFGASGSPAAPSRFSPTSRTHAAEQTPSIIGRGDRKTRVTKSHTRCTASPEPIQRCSFIQQHHPQRLTDRANPQAQVPISIPIPTPGHCHHPAASRRSASARRRCLRARHARKPSSATYTQRQIWSSAALEYSGLHRGRGSPGMNWCAPMSYCCATPGTLGASCPLGPRRACVWSVRDRAESTSRASATPNCANTLPPATGERQRTLPDRDRSPGAD